MAQDGRNRELGSHGVRELITASIVGVDSIKVLCRTWCVVGPKKQRISKMDLEAQLNANPNTTHKELGVLFGCSDKTIARELKRNGLRTKLWSERTHTAETRSKISQAHISSGALKGAKNPNYGAKHRPWLEGDRHPFRQWHKKHPDFGDKQRGANNPVHSVSHLYTDPGYVEKITSGIRQHVIAKTGKSYEAVYGEEKAAEYKEKLRLASPARMAKFKRKITAPEKTVSALLASLGVAYVEQAPLGYYTVDFLVPSVRLVIQADGDYWHVNPKLYPDESTLSDTQRKRRRLDASCDSFLRNRGFTVVRFWEYDLKHGLDECFARLTTLVNRLKNQII